MYIHTISSFLVVTETETGKREVVKEGNESIIMVETVWISMKFPRFYIPNSHLISSHLKIPHLHIKIATPLLYQVCLLSLLQVLMMLQCK